MLSAAVAALACLCLAHTSPAETYGLRAYVKNIHAKKDMSEVLASIDERLRLLETVSAVQVTQARHIDAIQDKLDRVETTMTLKLERAQLAAERLEHRIHMLQTNVQNSIKESTEKLDQSQAKIVDLTRNLTQHIEIHKRLLEKVNGAYADTWHRGLLLESLMRDGLSLVNATRRELADGLRALARRQRDARMTSVDLEASFAKRLNDNTYKIDLKMQEVLDAQKHFVDSCQRVQLDDPHHVANVLDKLFDSLIDKIASIFHELQSIQVTLRDHDTTVTKLLNTIRTPQGDMSCRRLESVFRNTSHSILKETELKQLTEKFVSLTDRADAALQRLEMQLGDDISQEDLDTKSEVSEVANNLISKLKGIKEEQNSDDELDWEEDEAEYFEDRGGDIMEEDKKILSRATERVQLQTESTTARLPHRRHLHKHPYDRGPRRLNLNLN